MNRNPKSDEHDIKQNVYGLRKITYWERYGVKRFPYSGRRKSTPLVTNLKTEGLLSQMTFLD